MADDPWMLSDAEVEALTPAEAAEFERLLARVTSGKWTLDDNPKAHLAHLLAYKVDWLLAGGAAGGGKALALDTPVPTPDGWTTMGALAPGDRVWHPSGAATMVLAVSDVMVGRPCRRVVFDDGSSFVADDGHLWSTWTASDMAAMTRAAPAWQAQRRAQPRVAQVRTTKQIAESLTVGTCHNHAVAVTAPLDGLDVEVPIDPYLLGVWLGDGSSASGQVTTMDVEIVDAFTDAGYPVTVRRHHEATATVSYRFDGWFRQLCLAGLIENKHVPDVYLRGSAEQRLALLQGLMDAGGSVDVRGKCEFTSTCRNLADAVAFLACSLGHIAVVRESRATLNGQDCSPKYQVSWLSPHPPFRLSRKLARWRPPAAQVTRFRWITSCEPVESVPVRCITVAAPDGMFLVGAGCVPTHNSEMLLYHAREVCASIPGAHVLIVRTSKPELQRSLVVRSLVRFAQTGDNRRAKLAQRDNVRAWWWQNRSILEFGHLDSEATAAGYLSAEYDLFCADESTQLTPKVISMLTGRLRTTVAKAAAGSRPHAVFASNPGDISHEWHKELFVDLTDYGRYVVILDISEGFMTDDGAIDWEKCVIVDRVPCPQTPGEAARFTVTTTPEQLSVAFVPFRASDNPHLDPSVMRGLNALPEMQRKQRRDGDWDAFTGRYFTEFGDPHIVTPFEIDDESFDIGIGLDHGYSAPFAAVFGAWDGDGNCYIFDEVYEKQLTPSEQARLVRARLVVEDGHGKVRPMRHRVPVADPATFNSKGEGLSIAQQWANAGLHCVQANNARVDGWMNVREYLRVPLDDRGVGRPKLFVFSTCTDTIREFRNARCDPRRPDDVDTAGDDHALDAVRYLLATRPRTRRRTKQGERWDLPRAERIEHARLEKFRRMGKRQARRLGLG